MRLQSPKNGILNIRVNGASAACSVYRWTKLCETIVKELWVNIVSTNYAVDLLVSEARTGGDTTFPNRRNARHHHCACREAAATHRFRATFRKRSSTHWNVSASVKVWNGDERIIAIEIFRSCSGWRLSCDDLPDVADFSDWPLTRHSRYPPNWSGRASRWFGSVPSCPRHGHIRKTCP